MRNFEKTSKPVRLDQGVITQRKGTKRNKTQRGGGLKGKFLNPNTGKSYLGEVWEIQ